MIEAGFLPAAVGLKLSASFDITTPLTDNFFKASAKAVFKVAVLIFESPPALLSFTVKAIFPSVILASANETVSSSVLEVTVASFFIASSTSCKEIFFSTVGVEGVEVSHPVGVDSVVAPVFESLTGSVVLLLQLTANIADAATTKNSVKSFLFIY